MRKSSLTITVRVALWALIASAVSPVADVAAAAERNGTTAAGVPIALDGQTAHITVPKPTRRGSRIVLNCGRHTTADLLTSDDNAFAPTVFAHAAREFRVRRRMTLRLNRDVSAFAEWCEFHTLPEGRSGAAVLKPKVAPQPTPLVAGPGVREAITKNGEARFLLDGSTLTLRTDKPLPGDIVLALGCEGAAATPPPTPAPPLERLLGIRSVAIGDGRRAVTVDLGRDVEAAAHECGAGALSPAPDDIVPNARFKS